ncbi:MAG: lipopolysaccharide transport periplasmic protein LptA [Gammaproteobacteria bacterium]|nr:lipopolysaccharide transport periplasmic protein LptA [Gammaproteobacteria bacterium]
MTSLAELKAAMLLVLLASTAAPLVAVAQTAPKTPPVDRKDLVKLPKPTDLKPTGPVTLTSDKAELVQGNSAVYTGNVVLSSDTLKLEGDRVELKQYAGGQYEAKITGGPAKMNHAGNGADNPPVSARAKTLNYDSRSGVLDLISDAYVMRGNDEITGDTIKYDVNQRRIQASGGTGGQVKIILQPSSSEPAAPVAAPGAAP